MSSSPGATPMELDKAKALSDGMSPPLQATQPPNEGVHDASPHSGREEP